MRTLRYFLYVPALLLALLLGPPSQAQEWEPDCQQLAQQEGGGPTLQIVDTLTLPMIKVLGCEFEAGERVRLDARLKVGNGEFESLSPVVVEADLDGTLEASFETGLEPSDIREGYHFEVTASGGSGSRAQTGIAAIASSGLAPTLPEAGAGGEATSPFESLPAWSLPVVLMVAVIGLLTHRLLAR